RSPPERARDAGQQGQAIVVPAIHRLGLRGMAGPTQGRTEYHVPQRRQLVARVRAELQPPRGENRVVAVIRLGAGVRAKIPPSPALIEIHPGLESLTGEPGERTLALDRR